MYRSQKDMQDGYAYHQRIRHMKMIDIFLSLACLSCFCHTLGRHVLPFFKNSFRRGSWGWTAYGEEYGIPEVTKRNGICSVEGRLRLGNSWVSLAQLPPESELQSDSPTWILMTWADSSVRWKMDIQHIFFIFCWLLCVAKKRQPQADCQLKECTPSKRLIFNMNNFDRTSRVDVRDDGLIRWYAGERINSAPENTPVGGDDGILSVNSCLGRWSFALWEIQDFFQSLHC